MAYKSRVSTEKLVELYQSGMEPEEIAKEYGYKNGDFITTKLRQAGVYRGRRLDTGKIYALHKAGWNNRDIAFDVDTTEEEVERVLNDRL